MEVGTQWYLYYSADPGNYLTLGTPAIGLAREISGVRSAQISVNGGQSWSSLALDAYGNWTYSWTPTANGLYAVQVRVTDDWMQGTPSQTTVNVGTTVDRTPPVISIVSPTSGSVLSSGTTSVVVSISTDENAYCKYSLTNSAFNFSIEGTSFSSGEGTLQHSFTLSGLQPGQSYTLYYKAMDSSGNIDATSVVHSFSVAAANASVWWNSSWLYRKSIVLKENSGTTLSGYEVNFIVSFASSKMNATFSDLRFTDQDKLTPLPFWIESYNASSAASVWVKVPAISASGTRTIYMYYGNPSASSAANGDATFEFFDDFNDGSLNASKWVTSGVVTESNGYLQVGSGSDSIARQNTTSYQLFSGPYVMRQPELGERDQFCLCVHGAC